MADIIQIRRGTASQWTSTNPVLADGELGFEKDTKKGKLGDGVTTWNSLPYSFTGEVQDDVATQITASSTKTTPVDADQIGITDSEASNVLKKLSWANVKATLKTYFDTLYAAINHNQNASTIQAGTFATGNFEFPGNLDIVGQAATPVFSKGNISGSNTVNWNQGNAQSMTLIGNVTFTFSNPKSGASYQLFLINDGTVRTVVWPTIKWRGGSAPTLTGTNGKIDIITLTYDGSAYSAVFTLNH